jgi:hypothetical protein
MTVLETVRDSFRERWGKPSRTSRFEVGKVALEVQKWDARSNPEHVVLYVTVGASSWPLTGRPPQERIEFFTGLLRPRDEVANSLAALAAYSVREGVALDHGRVVPCGEPLWPGSAMATLLVARARPGFLPPLETADGIHVQFLQAVPIYESERAYTMEYGVDALLECWSEAHTRHLDPDRSPNAVCLARSGLGAKTFLGV